MNYIISKHGAKFPRKLTWEWTKNRYHWCAPLSQNIVAQYCLSIILKIILSTVKKMLNTSLWFYPTWKKIIYEIRHCVFLSVCFYGFGVYAEKNMWFWKIFFRLFLILKIISEFGSLMFQVKNSKNYWYIKKEEHSLLIDYVTLFTHFAINAALELFRLST